MADFDPLKNILRRTTQLCVEGRNAEALTFVEASLAEAKQEDRTNWSQILTINALAIAHSMGDQELVRRYSEQGLFRDPGDTFGKALSFYTLADVLFRQGETDLAKQHAAGSYALVVQSNTQAELGLRELLTKRWPKIADWQGL